MIALLRVDNRLIHGQIVSAWLPHLHVKEVVVADAEAAGSALMRAAMTMAVPPPVEVQITTPRALDFEALAASAQRVLLLVRDIEQAEIALDGRSVELINLGNIHFVDGRKELTSSLFLSCAELDALAGFEARGIQVEARALPSDQPIALPQLRARFQAAP